MKDLRKIKRNGYSEYVVIKGYKVPILGIPSVTFDAKVNLDDMTFIGREEPEYKDSALPTINDLIASKVVEHKSYLETYEIIPKGFDNYRTSKYLTDKMIEQIIAEFKEHGYNVSKRAIYHNYYSWRVNFKSGYKGKGYHLFTPCGLNPLVFRATKLSSYCKDWQITYIC